MKNTKQDAAGKWHGILSRYIPKEHLTGKHTECPLCGGVDRFRFDDKTGNGSYFCNTCGAGTGIHLLAQHQGIAHSEAWKLVDSLVGTVQARQKAEKTDGREIIGKILKTCKPAIECDEVCKYLSSRNIKSTPETILSGLFSLGGEQLVCMVGKASLGRKMTGLHVTYLRDGKKVDRRMYAIESGSMTGSAVRLAYLCDGDSLVIGEGIETSLSAGERFRLPAWAAMDAGKLEKVIIPPQVKNIIIAGDCDESFTGQASAYILAKRLKKEGLNVRVEIPDKIGDWNDYAKD